MELAAEHCTAESSLMAHVIQVYSIDYVAKTIGANEVLIEAGAIDP